MKKELIIQKLVGILVLMLTAVYIWLDKDCTAAIITVPMGLALIFSKESILGNYVEDEEEYWD